MRVYVKDPSQQVNESYIAFEQSFPCGYKPSTTKNWVLSDWPYFTPLATAAFDRCALFNGHFAGALTVADVSAPDFDLHRCKVETQGGVPLALYSTSADGRVGPSLLLSQLSRIKTGEMYAGGKGGGSEDGASETAHISLGLKGTLTEVPVGFTASWIASGSLSGMGSAFEQWGDAVLKASGKARWGVYDDPIASGLGWWTDNGGYYHYGGIDPASGKPLDPPSTAPGGYERAMAAVHLHHQQLQIPFRHWQLDSWWYPKGKGENGSSTHHEGTGHGGVYRWTADPFVFPSGVPKLQASVDLPFVQHNRWFGPDNYYKAEWRGAGEWVGNDKCVLPLDLDTFWDFFFDQVEDYGGRLSTYEQDFMYTQYDNVAAMQTNATYADDWIRSFTTHAAQKNLTVQFCMPYARDFLASTAHPNVVTIRASGDYHAGRDQWRISRTSLLAHALGLLPFKDTFYTSEAVETGGADRDAEPNAELQTIVATLSGSIVGPGDGLGLTNVTRLMRCCTSDGLVLKAARPAVPIDAQWTASGPGGEVSWTYTEVAASRRTFYVLAAAVASRYKLTPSDLLAPPATSYIAYDWATGTVAPFSAGSPIELAPGVTAGEVEGRPEGWAEGWAEGQVGSLGRVEGRVDWSLYVLAPIVSGWALIGDPSKYVTTSSKRIEAVAVQPADARLHITSRGIPGENLTACAYSVQAGCMRCGWAVAVPAGTALISLSPV